MINPFETIDTRLSSIEKLLLDMKHQVGSENAAKEKKDPEILSAKQASEFLNIALSTLYSLCSRRVLTSYKRQKKLYFKRSELLLFIQNGRRNSAGEVREKALAFTKSN